MAAESADALLQEEAWTEQGFAAIKSLPETLNKLGQQRAQSEHLAIALLQDEFGVAARVVKKAGASADDLKLIVAGAWGFTGAQRSAAGPSGGRAGSSRCRRRIAAPPSRRSPGSPFSRRAIPSTCVASRRSNRRCTASAGWA